MWSLIAMVVWLTQISVRANADVLSPALPIPAALTSVPAGGHLDYLRDSTNSLSLNDVRAKSAEWKVFAPAVPNFGFSQDSHWLRLQLAHEGEQSQTVLLEVAYPSLNTLEIHELTSDGRVISHHLGNLVPFDAREYKNRNYVIELELGPREAREIYLRVHTEGAVQLPITLWNPRNFAMQDQRFVLGQGLYFGVVLALALYNLFLFFSVRDPSYVYYILSVLSFGLFQASLQGLAFQYLWPEVPAFNKYAIPLWANIFGFSASFFAVHFLQLRERHRSYSRPLVLAGRFMFVMMFLLPLVKYHYALRIVTGVAVLVSLLTIFMSFRLWLAGNKQARLFLIAWISLLLGLAVFGLSKFGILPHNVLTEYGVQVGHAMDVILLSMALADRINLLRHEKIELLNHANATERAAGLVMHEANQKLQEALTLSEQQRRNKDEFMMTVSHELRTPLNSINNALVQMHNVRSEDDRRALEAYIQGSAERLSTQVENVVMLVESGFADIQPQSRLFFVDSLIERAARSTASLLMNKPVELLIEKTGKPNAAYLGDEYLLFRFLLPVLTNACQYTTKGSVICQADLSDNAIDLIIIDTGPGISPEHQKAIFERFTQVSTGFQRTHEGLGIGLAVCQRIGKLLGATISLESTPGFGSRFHLHIPAQAMPGLAAPADSALSGHALIVEDNEINATVLATMLNTLGMTAEVAENGQQALDIMQTGRFDIILMDLQMPVMDGFAATEALRKRGTSCPIVAVSANSDSATRLRCIELGMNDFVAKPIDMHALKEKLLYWLNHAPLT